MKITTRTVWSADSGAELIVKRSDSEYQIIPATCDLAKLIELRDACNVAIVEATAPFTATTTNPLTLCNLNAKSSI